MNTGWICRLAVVILWCCLQAALRTTGGRISIAENSVTTSRWSRVRTELELRAFILAATPGNCSPCIWETCLRVRGILPYLRLIAKRRLFGH